MAWNEFEILERKGYKDLLAYCETKEGVEARYWEMVSLMWIGKKGRLEKLFNEAEHLFDTDFWRSRYLQVRGTFHWGHDSFKAQGYFDEAFEIATKINDLRGIAYYYIYTAILRTYPEKFDEYYEKGGTIAEEIDDIIGRFWYSNYLKYKILREKGAEEGEKAFLKQMDWVKGEGNLFWYALTLGQYGGFIRQHKGLREAIPWYERANALARQEENGWEIANSYGNLASIYLEMGDLNRSLEYAELRSTQEIKMNHKSRISASLARIGHIYQAQGEYKKALQRYEFARDTYVREQLFQDERMGYHLLCAGIYTKLGMRTRAKESLDIVYEYSKEHEDYSLLSGSLIRLVELYVHQEREVARDYLDELSTLPKNDLPQLENDRIYLEALYLKTSTRLPDKMRAIASLELVIKIWKEKDIERLEPVLHLVELLLIEYESTQNPAVLSEINSYLIDLIARAERQNQFPLLIRTFIIQAQIAQFNGDFDVALHHYDTAVDVCYEKELELLLEEAKLYRKLFKEKISDLQQKLLYDPSKLKRIHESNLLEYITVAQNSLKSLQ